MKLKKIFFTFLFILLVWDIKIVKAVDAQPSPNMSSDKACKIKSSPGYSVRVRMEFNNKFDKYGIIYNMSLGKHLVNGVEVDAPTFCLDPGKGNQTNYTIGSKVSRVSSAKEIHYYKIYQWYLDNVSSLGSQASMIAQTMVWYLEDMGANTFYDKVKLKKLFEAVYYTSLCNSNVENKIKTLIDNPKFTCTCFLTDWGAQVPECLVDNMSGFEFTLEQYIELFKNGSIVSNTNAIIQNNQVVESMTEQGYGILTSYHKQYPGDLYYWQPTGGTGSYQRLIGIYGCPPGEQKNTCNTEVEKLKIDFGVDERKDTNAAYMAEIVRLTTKYPEQFNADDLTNPKCDPDPPIDRPPECPPTYNEYACTFYNPNNNGGFYISDAKNGDDPKEACYLGNNIAYRTDGGQEVSSKADDLSNEYCTLYCWEAFGADFPAAIANIKAGTKFFWGRDITENMFGNLNAVRKCKTTNINYDQFIADWSANEDNISTAYSRYVDQRNFNNKNNYDKTEACTLTATCEQTGTVSAGCPEHYWEWNGKCITMAADDPDCERHSGTPGSSPLGPACITNETEIGTTTVCSKCPTGYTNSSGTSCTKAGTKYIRNAVGTAASTSACMESNSSATDIDAKLDNPTELTNRQNAVSQLISGRKSLSTKIEACQSKSVTNENSMYEYKGKVVLNYSDPAGVDRNIQSPIELENYKSNTSVITNGVSSGARATRCESTPDIKNGDNCFANNTLATYSSYEWNFTGLWYYKYSQSDFYWRSIVENAHVVNEKTYTADYSGMKIVPYELGYGIPTAFSLKTGFYEISVDVTGFGNHGTHFDKLLQEENVSVYNYACPYHVVNELYGMECNFQCDFNTRTCTLTADSPAYCDNEVKGIDLVYRVIEMASGDSKKIFPSIDGDGRNPGTNWSTFIANKSKAYKNITTPSVIYDDEPIYEIDLTPTLINQIRRDNLTYREQSMDPYTSYTDANNHEKVICEGVDTNRTCASHYITTLINQNVLNGEYADCQNCGSTAERLKYIDSMKERYNN